MQKESVMENMEHTQTAQPVAPPRGATNWFAIGLVSLVIGALAGGLVGGGLLWAASERPEWLETLGFDRDAVDAAGDGTDVVRTEVVVEEDSNVIDVVKQANPAVVSIIGTIQQRSFFFNQVIESEAAGTGFVIDRENGIILTNRHVVSEDGDYRILTSNGTEIEVPEDNIHIDPLNDLAILWVEIPDAAEVSELTLGMSSELQPGQSVIAIGNALGKFNNTVTTGVVSALGRQINVGDALGEEELLIDLVQTDAAINQGNSGGPLLNSLGQVIGINTAVAGGSENIGFAIPIDDAKVAIESYLENGRIVRPWLGITYVQITENIAAAYDLPVDRGAYVTEVVADTPAAKAGIRVDDILLEIDDQALSPDNTIIKVLQNYQVDDTVRVRLQRPDDVRAETPQYEEMTLDVTLEARQTEPQRPLLGR
jgi:S1-C subfamily serine protease